MFAKRGVESAVSNRIFEQFLMRPGDVMGVRQLVGHGLLNFGHSLFSGLKSQP
jgi:hypothetical protein